MTKPSAIFPCRSTTSWAKLTGLGIALLLATSLVRLSAGASGSEGLMVEPGPTIVERGASTWVRLDESGRLVYGTDDRGNRIPDFSDVGYHGGERPIPDVPVRMTLLPAAAATDDTDRLQRALDAMGALPIDDTGFRGALLLQRGIYRIAGHLNLRHSGVVLRGEGDGPDGTILVATGFGQESLQRTLITVGLDRSGDGVVPEKATRRPIADPFVPIGARTFTVSSTDGYHTGDRILVHRRSTAEWIHAIGADRIPPRWGAVRDTRWQETGSDRGFYYRRDGMTGVAKVPFLPGEAWADYRERVGHLLSEGGTQLDFTVQWQAGEYDIDFERTIVSIDGPRITIDAPIVHALDRQWGESSIMRYPAPTRVVEVGIENLRVVSEFGPPIPGEPLGDPALSTTSELHGWTAIRLQPSSENTWVRRVTGSRFGFSLVAASGRNATVRDCVNLNHASEITGGRRYPFLIDGQLNLVQRCVAIEGRHEFVTQARTTGPNVFVDCLGIDSKSVAGPHHRYSVGTLFDNIRSENPMESRWRGNLGTGHGWAGTQTLFYNCTAPRFDVSTPPGGISWVIGSGPQGSAAADRVAPASLYYAQLRERLGPQALDWSLAPSPGASTAPQFVPLALPH